MKTWSKLGLVAVSVLGAVACGSGDKGDPGAAGQPGPQGGPGATGSNGTGVTSFSLIEPRMAVLARDIDVVLSVQGIKLDAAPTIDFGDAKITVSNIQVVSDTTLYAHLKIDSAATIGKKDVKITTGGTPLIGTGAFEVKAGMDIKLSPATAKQGSVVKIDLTNNDADNPFDANSFTVTLPAGLDALGGGASVISGKKATITALVEPTATPGASQLSGVDASSNTYLSAPGVLTVVANSPVALSGTKNETLSHAGDTLLYSYSTNNDVIVSLNVTTASTDTTIPQVLILPSNGHFADALGVLEVPQVPDPNNFLGTLPAPPPYDVTISYPMSTTTATSAFAMINDLNSTTSGANSKLAVTLTTTTAVAYTEAAGAHADTSTPQTAAACVAAGVIAPCLIKGTTASTTEIDVYKITGVSANTVLEVSANVGTAGIDVYAEPSTATTVDGSETDFANGISLAQDISFHTGSDVTLTPGKAWFIVVAAQANEPTGAYTIGIRTAP